MSLKPPYRRRVTAKSHRCNETSDYDEHLFDAGTLHAGTMTRGGTEAYEDPIDIPELVRAAVAQARSQRFDLSCLPQQGRLLQVLSRGHDGGLIAETGTGCGVGLAWMVSATGPDTTLVSVEQNGLLARGAQALFEPYKNVTVIHGDWKEIRPLAPFDLLVLDGGGQGKGEEAPIDPANGWLRPGGTVVIDDFTPSTGWPPMHANDIDRARLYWLEHHALLTTEIRVRHDATTLVGTLK